MDTKAVTGSASEVFAAFLKLGLTSFGGPIAHLGYFRNEFVERRNGSTRRPMRPWSRSVNFFRDRPPEVSCTASSSSLSLSSHKPSGACREPSHPIAPALALRSRRLRSLFFFAGSFGQIAAIVLGACAGLWLCRGEVAPVSGHLNFPVTRRAGLIALVLFAALLLIPPAVVTATGSQALALFDAFYRSGALVFGGGHVVLPLLQAQVVTPGWVSNEAFLAGYGLARAVPGPLFTFAAYLGAVMGPAPNGVAGATIALVALLLPGMLLVYGMLPFWDAMRTRPAAQAAMRGTNAAVVGILGAALYNPVWTSAVLTPRDFALALTGFLLLTIWKQPPWIVVVLLAGAGTLSQLV